MRSRARALEQQGEDRRLGRRVEARRRLIGDQQRWLASQGDREHHALTHAAGEFAGISVGRAAPRPGCAPRSAHR